MKLDPSCLIYKHDFSSDLLIKYVEVAYFSLQKLINVSYVHIWTLIINHVYRGHINVRYIEDGLSEHIQYLALSYDYECLKNMGIFKSTRSPTTKEIEYIHGKQSSYLKNK